MLHRVQSPAGGAAILGRALAVVIILAGGLWLTPASVAAQGLPGFADLAERLSPAVVNISTAQTIDQPGVEGMPFPEGSPFDDLFRDFFDQNRKQGPQTVQSLGSGFIISPEGFVVTNNHVIADADEITVNLADGSSLEARLVGTDPKTDIALLKVEPDKPLPFVNFGDSDAIRVGDWVLAIGNPFGLGGSVSAGIVSARNRDINAGPYDDFIQTDAAINRGNSGGPLFNMAGEVIGVNSAIISPSGGSIGIGFSVPANMAKAVVAQLREYGVTRRGWLGVRIQTVNPEIADALGMAKPMGALVEEVTRDAPAEQGGIEPGDVIVKFDGRDVVEMRELPRLVADTEVGKTVRVVVFRKGKTVTLKVKIGLLEEENGTAEPKPTAPEHDNVVALPDLGLKLAPLSDAARAQYGIAPEVTGVLIAEVAAGSPADQRGIAPGNVVVEVGQVPVADPAAVEAGVRDAVAAGRKSVLFLVQSGADLRFVPLALGGG